MNEERGGRRRECETDAKMRGVGDKQRKEKRCKRYANRGRSQGAEAVRLWETKRHQMMKHGEEIDSNEKTD